jgi:hypothetical protein
LVENNPTKKFLDLGCGDFYLGKYSNVDGYDVELPAQVHNNIKLYNGKNVPEPDGKYDYIIHNNVIEHIMNLEEAVIVMKSVLKKNGYMIHSCPNYLIPYDCHYKVWFPFIHFELKDEQLWKNINFISGNLVNEDFLKSLDNYDIILHGANYGQPGKFMENKIETILLNTYTTNCLINKLNKGGKFLFISSSEVYSGLEKESYNENDMGMTNSLHDRACYIESKKWNSRDVNTVSEFCMLAFSRIIVSVSNQQSESRYKSVNKNIQDKETIGRFKYKWYKRGGFTYS